MALYLQKIDDAFPKSALKPQYRKSFVQGLEPGPFRAKFLLKFSNKIHDSKLRPEFVAQEMIHGFQEARDKVAVDVNSVKIKDYKDLCLVRPTSLLSVITGVIRKPSSPKDWPFVVRLMEDGVPVCDGCLIAENWVLTAGKCVAPGNFSLYTVKLALHSKDASLEQSHSVAKIVHSSGTPMDFALIQLAESAPTATSAQPVCLPDPSYVASPGTECWALGSEENHAAKPEVLRWTVTSQTGCHFASSSDSTCAETAELKEPLQMIAGGPFLCLGENQQVYLEGILPASGESQEEPKVKIKDRLAAFPRVAPLVSWIKSQLFP